MNNRSKRMLRVKQLVSRFSGIRQAAALQTNIHKRFAPLRFDVSDGGNFRRVVWSGSLGRARFGQSPGGRGYALPVVRRLDRRLLFPA
jgi:hypothetical protein